VQLAGVDRSGVFIFAGGGSAVVSPFEVDIARIVDLFAFKGVY
jgi:hypothetical protein